MTDVVGMDFGLWANFVEDIAVRHDSKILDNVIPRR